MLRTLRAGVVPATMILLAGCLHVGPDSNSVTLDFNFTVPDVSADWEVGAADFPVGSEADVADSGGVRTLPSPLPTTQQALYQSGTNPTGNLFVFQKKRFVLLAPNTSYRVALSLEFASNVQSGCTSPLATSVWVKAGVSGLEPIVAPDAGNVYRLNLDKGEQSLAGDYTQLSYIKNGLAGCPTTGTYSLRTTARQTQTAFVTSDAEGGFWLFIGTQ